MIDPREAAQAIFPSMARALQKLPPHHQTTAPPQHGEHTAALGLLHHKQHDTQGEAIDRGDSQSGGFYHKIIPDRVIMNNLEGVHFTIRLAHMEIGRQPGMSGIQWSCLYCRLRCFQLIVFEGSIMYPSLPLISHNPARSIPWQLNFKNKDGAWELSPNLYCFVVNH